jgi:uncharacterized protein YsxB (DUF464 family)
MSMQEDNFEELFKKLKGRWDTEEPALGHQQRFLEKLEGKKKKNKFLALKLVIPFAAAVAILAFFIGDFGTVKTAPQQQVAKLSPQVQETQMYFNSIIRKELAKVEQENSPETKVLVQDALAQMEDLEKDYDKLTKELMARGENKKLIHAMITNLQTRISFLEDVLERIENIKKLKEKYNEKHVSLISCCS